MADSHVVDIFKIAWLIYYSSLQTQSFDMKNALGIFFTVIFSIEDKIGRLSHNERHLISQLREIYVFKNYNASRTETAEEIVLHEE